VQKKATGPRVPTEPGTFRGGGGAHYESEEKTGEAVREKRRGVSVGLSQSRGA